MLILTTVLAVVVLPMTGLAALLLAVGRMERAREARIARQVGVTDAIHRELGAVVAPVVKRRIGRGWRVEIAVPFESPAIVGRVVAIAHAVMLGSRAGRLEVVLTAQEPQRRAMNVRTRPQAGMSTLPASEREVVAWTGTTTSRAS
jgi:hypothetical protein